MRLLVCACLVLSLLGQSFAAIMHDDLKLKKEYGTTVRYCEYNGLQMLPFSVIRNSLTCEKCKCTRRGLECTTAPVMYGPDSSECVSVLIACKSTWRLRSDTGRRCPRSKIPKEIMAVGKK